MPESCSILARAAESVFCSFRGSIGAVICPVSDCGICAFCGMMGRNAVAWSGNGSVLAGMRTETLSSTETGKGAKIGELGKPEEVGGRLTLVGEGASEPRMMAGGSALQQHIDQMRMSADPNMQEQSAVPPSGGGPTTAPPVAGTPGGWELDAKHMPFSRGAPRTIIKKGDPDRPPLPLCSMNYCSNSLSSLSA